MSFKVIEKPKILPISLEMAKTYLRLSHGEEDDLIQHLIQASCEWIQESTGKSLLRQRCVFVHGNQDVFLPFGPVLNVTQVRVKQRVLTDQEYRLDKIEGRLSLNLPLSKRSSSKVCVTYEAGYGDQPEEIPAAIRNAILTTLAHLYENREASQEKGSILGSIRPWIQYHKTYHLA